MSLYCEEALLLCIYFLLAISINFFVFRIFFKNIKKLENFSKYKKVLRLYNTESFGIYLGEFFEKKEIKKKKVGNLISFRQSKIIKEGFYSKLLKFEFTEKV